MSTCSVRRLSAQVSPSTSRCPRSIRRFGARRSRGRRRPRNGCAPSRGWSRQGSRSASRSRRSCPGYPTVRNNWRQLSAPHATRVRCTSGPTCSTSSRGHASISCPAWRATGPSSCRCTSGSTPGGRICRPTRQGRSASSWPICCAGTGSPIVGHGPWRLRRSRRSWPSPSDAWSSRPGRRIARMAGEITCLIVDDHEVVREGLRLALSRSPQVRVVGEAGDGEAAIALVERRRPDVVLMDIRMPGMDGLDATRKILEREPRTAVIIFTAYSERALLARGLESGARGYVVKEAAHDTLLRAIEKVASGESFVDPALMPSVLAAKDREELLTAREREILRLLADGMSNSDVAAKLFISQETVKSHVRHILTKLEADTRTHAVAIALRESMID